MTATIYPQPKQLITRYELPPEGISLLGYVVRRMHKTSLLLPVKAYLDAGLTAEALAQVALYGIGASVSYGPAYYQPRFDTEGATAAEADPATGAKVSAKLEATSPHYRLSYKVRMPDGARFHGAESIEGTTVTWRGLGMPAPAHLAYASGDQAYTAEMTGIVVSELAPRMFGHWRIRAHGELSLKDSASNAGTLTVSRAGRVKLDVTAADGTVVRRYAQLAPDAK